MAKAKMNGEEMQSAQADKSTTMQEVIKLFSDLLETGRLTAEQELRVYSAMVKCKAYKSV